LPPSRALTEPVAEPTRLAEAGGIDAEPFTEPLAERVADTPVLVEGTAGPAVVSPPPLTEAVMVAGRSVRTWVSAESPRRPGLPPRRGRW